MQSAGGVDYHDIGTIRLCRRERVKKATDAGSEPICCFITGTPTRSPQMEICSTAAGSGSVGCPDKPFFSRFLELVSKFADSRRLADTIHADHKNNVRLMVGRQVPVLVVTGIVFREQAAIRRALFRSAPRWYIFVACHTLFNTLYDFLSVVSTPMSEVIRPSSRLSRTSSSTVDLPVMARAILSKTLCFVFSDRCQYLFLVLLKNPKFPYNALFECKYN